MTFTYDVSSPTDRERVRFHLGDTDENTAMFSDEEIAWQITEEGTWQKAVISCLHNIAVRAAQDEDIEADWLTLRRRNTDWDALIRRKQRELGLLTISATAKPVYRADSLQTEAPDWD